MRKDVIKIIGLLVLFGGSVLLWFLAATVFLLLFPFLYIIVVLYFVISTLVALKTGKPTITDVSFLVLLLVGVNLLFFDPASMYFYVYSEFFQYFFVAIVVFLVIIAIIKIFEYFKYNPFKFIFAPRIKVLKKCNLSFVPIRSDDDYKDARAMLFNFLVNKYTKEEAEKTIQNNDWSVKKDLGFIVVKVDNNFKTFLISEDKIEESVIVDKNSEEGKILYSK